MRRLARLIPALLAGALLLVPSLTFAQESLFGPIIPQFGACRCEEVAIEGTTQLTQSAPNYGCILQAVQAAINVGLAIGVVLFVLVIAYAGFLLVTNATNPGAIGRAKSLIKSAFIGLAIAFIAWLGIDFVMKAIYNPAATFSGQDLGPWNAIWSPNGDDLCLVVRNPFPLTQGSLTLQTSAPIQAGFPGTGGGACSPANVVAASVQGGQQIPDNAAQFLACVARPESNCGTRFENYSWNKGNRDGNASTAYGAFQPLIKTHAEKFEIPACYRAAGVPGPLNCGQAFTSRGFTIPGQTLQRCLRAAASLSCNTLVSYRILQTQGPTAWSGNPDSKPAHQRCTNAYRQSGGSR